MADANVCSRASPPLSAHSVNNLITGRDFCVNRKHAEVQWKGLLLQRCSNPVWFGDKLKSTEGE